MVQNYLKVKKNSTMQTVKKEESGKIVTHTIFLYVLKNRGLLNNNKKKTKHFFQVMIIYCILN